MWQRKFLTKVGVCAVVSSVHLVSLAAMFYRSNTFEQSFDVGAESAVITMHQLNLGDAAQNTVEALAIGTPVEALEALVETVTPEEAIVPDEPMEELEIIAAHTDGPEALMEKVIEPEAPPKIEKIPEPKPAPKPVKKVAVAKPAPSPQRNADALQSSKAQTAAGAKPMVNELAFVKSPNPNYPRSARLRKETGRVVVLLEFNERGEPVSITIERSSGYGALDDSALKAARGIRSKPYYRQGQAISFRHRMVYDFNLT